MSRPFIIKSWMTEFTLRRTLNELVQLRTDRDSYNEFQNPETNNPVAVEYLDTDIETIETALARGAHVMKELMPGDVMNYFRYDGKVFRAKFLGWSPTRKAQIVYTDDRRTHTAVNTDSLVFIRRPQT